MPPQPQWIELWLQLGVSGMLGLLFLAAIRWVFPKMLDHVTASIALLAESHKQAVAQVTSSVERILADNRESREHCNHHIEEMREEAQLQRQHCEAMQESAWRHIKTQGERFVTLEALIRERG